MKIAFYAPLKAPDHPVPSGDRTIARLLFAALERAGAARGWEVGLASRFRSFDATGDAARQARLRAAGARFASRLIRRYGAVPCVRRPRLWFTYHLYHKAPDWLGPAVSDHLGIPYVVAEASHAAKQAGGRWGIGHEAAARAIRRADAIIALNRDDLAGVRGLAADPSRVTVWPAFLGPGRIDSSAERIRRGDGDGGRGEERPDPAGRPAPHPGAAGASPAAGPAIARGPGETAPDALTRRWGIPPGDPRLLCVAMMRGGRKLASFEALASALHRPALAAARWHLVVVGDGPARPEVEETFAPWLRDGRATFTGRVESEGLADLYAGSDLFVWPALGEPMGMAMLEAQGHGLPVVSARTRGVPDLVADGESGILVPEGDSAAFADAVRALLEAPERRRRMGRAARSRIAREHRFEAAVERIGALVEGLVGRAAAPREDGGRRGAGADRERAASRGRRS